MTNQESEIRIYVACLAAYNNGILHGRWINANQDTDDIYAAIREMLKPPLSQEQRSGPSTTMKLRRPLHRRVSGIEQVADFAAFIAEHGELGAKLVNHYGSLEAARETLEDYYAGEYSSLADFAQEMTESSTTIPDSLRYYIDWESMARDMEINDVLAIHLGFDRVHVFWSH